MPNPNALMLRIAKTYTVTHLLAMCGSVSGQLEIVI